jgi:hypothetical protein
MPSHGSANVAIVSNDAWRLELASVGTFAGSGNQSFVVGFLEPSTTYDFVLETSNAPAVGAFHTKQAPDRFGSRTLAIRPGDYVSGGTGGCTLGFLLRDATNETLYGLSAGHCLEDLGARVIAIPSATVQLPGQYPPIALGSVVFSTHAQPPLPAAIPGDADFALIQIDATVYGSIHPGVRHFGGPTGPWTNAQRSPGREVCHYGQGDLYGWIGTTRARCGQLEGFGDPTEYPWVIYDSVPSGSGDSGGPILDRQTGHAAGITLGAVPGVVTAGHDICFILWWLGAAGFDVQLLSAPTTGQATVVSKPGGLPFSAATKCPA